MIELAKSLIELLASDKMLYWYWNFLSMISDDYSYYNNDYFTEN